MANPLVSDRLIKPLHPGVAMQVKVPSPAKWLVAWMATGERVAGIATRPEDEKSFNSVAGLWHRYRDNELGCSNLTVTANAARFKHPE